MKFAREFLANALVGGLLIVLPIYLAVLVLLKGMQSVAALVRPLTVLLPAWLPAEGLLSLALVLVVCFLIGIAVRTRVGRILRERIERSLFERLPGYALFRSLTQRLAGEGRESAWKPALVEIEEALVPAFIIEELEDGRFTVFVPSVPTPFAGAVYILTRERVHALDVPFTQAISSISRWGSGSKDLVAAMSKGGADEASSAIVICMPGRVSRDFSARHRQFRRAKFTFAGGPRPPRSGREVGRADGDEGDRYALRRGVVSFHTAPPLLPAARYVGAGGR